ncbi:hypothetical protein JKY72_01880 [Candidatus Gracilibacteria bacterium]|nr:hypothetical protein [Candidatus Gracilibacteria bacterium]
MSQLVLNRGNSYRGAWMRRLSRRFQLGPYFLIGSLVFFVALITVITLMFSTRQVTKGNVLSSLNDTKVELVKEGEVLDMQLSRVKSMVGIEDSGQVSGMRRPAVVVYVNGDTAIASR